MSFFQFKCNFDTKYKHNQHRTRTYNIDSATYQSSINRWAKKMEIGFLSKYNFAMLDANNNKLYSQYNSKILNTTNHMCNICVHFYTLNMFVDAFYFEFIVQLPIDWVNMCDIENILNSIILVHTTLPTTYSNNISIPDGICNEERWKHTDRTNERTILRIKTNT